MATKTSEKPRSRKKKATVAPLLVAVAVDMSGSMSSVWGSAVEAVNSYVSELREQEGEILVTLTVWDGDSNHVRVKNIAVACPVADCPPLTAENYIPCGNTPLYDAIGRTVDVTRQALEGSGREDTRALVVVLTDGHENASVEYAREDVARLIAELEGTGRWTFVYLGAGHASLPEARQAAVGMGYVGENAMYMVKTNSAIRRSGSSLAAATVAHAASPAGSTNTFFADAGQTAKDYSDDPDSGISPSKPVTQRSMTDVFGEAK